MRPATLAQLRRIGLNPTPDTTGIHFDPRSARSSATSSYTKGYRRHQRTACRITSPGYWRPLNGFVAEIGTDSYPINSMLQLRNETLPAVLLHERGFDPSRAPVPIQLTLRRLPPLVPKRPSCFRTSRAAVCEIAKRSFDGSRRELGERV
jgi:hypothetical protein